MMKGSPEENRPFVLVLLGPPGAGKGTHALPLSKHLSIPHISTGDLFRENIRQKTALGLKAKTFIDQGYLVPDHLVIEILFERTTQADCKQGYILDGFPRTLAQAEALQLHLSHHHLLVLNLNLDDELIVKRITGRMACKGCGRPYHKLYDLPRVAHCCDTCLSPLLQRDDDREEIVRKRLEVYRTQTEPLIAYYRQKEVLQEINSCGEKERVFQEILNALPVVFLL